MEHAGLSFEDKIMDLRETLTNNGQEAMVVSEGDEIAWILNLRGEGSSSVGVKTMNIMLQFTLFLIDLYFYYCRVSCPLPSFNLFSL